MTTEAAVYETLKYRVKVGRYGTRRYCKTPEWYLYGRAYTEGQIFKELALLNAALRNGSA